MKLYQLFPNFIRLSFSEQVRFLRSYRERRARELEEYMKNKGKSSRILLSDEEKALIKVLGITQKDLKALKESIKNEL